MTVFGQLVIGPPGAGKTTYCNGIQQMLGQLKRDCAIINLDPANDRLPYEVTIDIRDLINVEDVMEEFQLGPNGALMYAMEYIVENLDWLKERFDQHCHERYVLIDMPGQVELYTHDDNLRRLVEAMQKWDARLCAVHLIDSVLCTDAFKYLSAVWVSLAAMLQLELPHVNLLSKFDVLKSHSEELAFRLEHYVGCEGLDHLMQGLREDPHPMSKRYMKFTQQLVDVVEDFGLVGFTPCNIQDKESVLQVLLKADQANGRCFAGKNDSGEEINLFDAALGSNDRMEREYLSNFQEQMDGDEACEADAENEASNGSSSAAPQAPKSMECEVCGKPAKMRCSRCKVTPYCGAACQRLDWTLHKTQCVKIEFE